MQVNMASGERNRIVEIGLGHTEGIHDPNGQLAVFVNRSTPRSIFVRFVEKDGLGSKLNRDVPQQRLTRKKPTIEHTYKGVTGRASLVFE
jgi:hypothetical protein